MILSFIQGGEHLHSWGAAASLSSSQELEQDNPFPEASLPPGRWGNHPGFPQGWSGSQVCHSRRDCTVPAPPGRPLGISHCPTSQPQRRRSLSSSSHLPNSSPPGPPWPDSRHLHGVTLHSLLPKHKRTQKGCVLSFSSKPAGNRSQALTGAGCELGPTPRYLGVSRSSLPWQWKWRRRNMSLSSPSHHMHGNPLEFPSEHSATSLDSNKRLKPFPRTPPIQDTENKQ